MIEEKVSQDQKQAQVKVAKRNAQLKDTNNDAQLENNLRKSFNLNGLPLKITGSKYLKPIHYEEEKGSAQCKSSVMLAALNAPGRTIIKAKKSRDHTELFFKYLKLPIKVLKKKNMI